MILLAGKIPLYEHAEWRPLASVMGHPLRLPVNELIVHHSYVPDIPCGDTVAREIEAMRSMDGYHTLEKKWGGFAYSYAIFQSGHVYVGRGHDRTGAHTHGRNSSSLGFVFVTDGSTSSLTAAARSAFHALVAQLIVLKALSPDYVVQGHDRYANKICPGAKINAQLPEMQRALVKNWPVLRAGDRGTAVSYLQQHLASVGLMPAQYVAGYFGPITLAAVQQFQERHKLVVDGICGPQTWAFIP